MRLNIFFKNLLYLNLATSLIVGPAFAQEFTSPDQIRDYCGQKSRQKIDLHFQFFEKDDGSIGLQSCQFSKVGNYECQPYGEYDSYRLNALTHAHERATQRINKAENLIVGAVGVAGVATAGVVVAGAGAVAAAATGAAAPTAIALGEASSIAGAAATGVGAATGIAIIAGLQLQSAEKIRRVLPRIHERLVSLPSENRQVTVSCRDGLLAYALLEDYVQHANNPMPGGLDPSLNWYWTNQSHPPGSAATSAAQ